MASAPRPTKCAHTKAARARAAPASLRPATFPHEQQPTAAPTSTRLGCTCCVLPSLHRASHPTASAHHPKSCHGAAHTHPKSELISTNKTPTPTHNNEKTLQTAPDECANPPQTVRARRYIAGQSSPRQEIPDAKPPWSGSSAARLLLLLLLLLQGQVQVNDSSRYLLPR